MGRGGGSEKLSKAAMPGLGPEAGEEGEGMLRESLSRSLVGFQGGQGWVVPGAQGQSWVLLLPPGCKLQGRWKGAGAREGLGGGGPRGRVRGRCQGRPLDTETR